uniref:Uncharacterized protein n=1 Tax=Octopus bimaculoides TaxID=37653 RepID=A0A0L8IBR9_OCTBM
MNIPKCLIGLTTSDSRGWLWPSAFTAITLKKYSVPSIKLLHVYVVCLGSTTAAFDHVVLEAVLYSIKYPVIGVPPSFSDCFHSRSAEL